MLEGLLNFFRDLLAPVIAIVVAYIAYQQNKTNRDRLRLELYEKRLKVFRGLTDLLGYIVCMGDITDEELSRFYTATNEKEFLFNDDILYYLEEFHKKALDLHDLEKKIKNQDKVKGKNREKVFDDRGEVFGWFTKQFVVSRKIFGKYLTFGQLAEFSERQTMNWKNGIKRIIWVLPLIGGVFTAFPICTETDVFFGETFANMWGEPFRYIIGAPLCLLTGFVPGYLVALIICWLAYWIVCWIIRGFIDTKLKDEQKISKSRHTSKY